MAEPAQATGRPGRSRFITWFLVATGAAVAFLSLCQRQRTLEKLSEWEFELGRAGKVLMLTERPELGSSRVPGLVLVRAGDAPSLVTAARGADGEAFAAALREAGFGGVVVAAGGAGDASVIGRLARARPGPHFHALMHLPDASLYEPVTPVRLDDDLLAFLVQSARSRLTGVSGEQIRLDAPADALEVLEGSDHEVALQLQGLRPREVATASAKRIRFDAIGTGVGPTLLDAVMDAAADVTALFEREHARAEGPLAQAVARYRIELHVLHSFTLVSHAAPGLDGESLRRFLDRVVEPGVQGVAVGWSPPRDGRALGRRGFRLRLPPDAVYWSRRDGSSVVERLLTDAHLGKLDELPGREHVTLDTFRSVHVMEREPGGSVIRLERGIAAVLPAEEPVETLRRVASRIARDMTPDGRLGLSYYPLRDQEWLGKGDEASRYDAHLHALGVTALREAAQVLGDADLARAADLGLGHMMRWLVACPGAGVVPGVEGSRILDSCGPVDERGRPVAVLTWGPGEPGGEVPDDIAFVVHSGTARLGTSALLLAGLVDRLGPSPARKERERLEPVIEGLVRFLLVMQRADGSFQSHFVVKDHGRYFVDEAGDSGMALLALARARTLLGDADLDAAIERGFAAHAAFVEGLDRDPASRAKSCARLAGRVPWMTFAALAAGRDATAGADLLVGGCPVLPDDDAVDSGLAKGVPGIDDVLAAWASALALGASTAGAAHESAVSRGARLALRLTVTPGLNDHYLPVPGRAMDGVGRDLLDHRQRVDGAFAVVALLSRVVGSGKK